MEYTKFIFGKNLDFQPYSYPELLGKIDNIDIFLLIENYEYPMERFFTFSEGMTKYTTSGASSSLKVIDNFK